MTSRVAVCLTTCGRYEYTARTLASFAAHNDLSRFELLHGDDGSDRALLKLVQSYGFETVVRHRQRQGWLPLRAALFPVAAERSNWILLLENDIESVRPFPWPLFEHVQALPWIYCLRLFGAFKGPDKSEPCKAVNQWRRNVPVMWKPLADAPEPSEFGRIHWSAQPAVTRAHELVALHCEGVRELRLKTARVLSNVMNHIGLERTARLEVAC